MKSMCHDSAAELAVGGRAQAHLLLHRARPRGSPRPRPRAARRRRSGRRRLVARLRAGAVGAAGCRRGRPGTGERCAAPRRDRCIAKLRDDRRVTDPADLGVVDATALLARRELSSRELVEACLARIRERDGVHSHEGDPASINAWVRVYEEDALAAADRADELAGGRRRAAPLRRAGRPEWGSFAVAGKPLTASSRLLREMPDRDRDVWARLAAAGMVLCSATPTRTSSRSAAPPTRSATRRRSTARPAARAAVPPRRSPAA